MNTYEKIKNIKRSLEEDIAKRLDKKNKYKFQFIVPVNSPSELDYTIEKDNLSPRLKDKMLYILHILRLDSNINKGRVKNKAIKNAVNKMYIQLHHDTLAEVLGTRDVKVCLKHLEHFGYIEIDNQYVKGSKSKGYRLARNYRDQDSKGYIVENKRFNNTLHKRKAKKQHDLLPHEIQQFKNIDKLTIDLDAALEYIVTDININTKNPPKKRKKKKNTNRGNYAIKVNMKYQMRIDAIRAFVLGVHFINKSQKTGRIFTNLTNFPSDLRRFLKYNNESFDEIDVVNSQLVIINKLLKIHLEQVKEDYKESLAFKTSENMLEVDDMFSILLLKIQKGIATTEELEDAGIDLDIIKFIEITEAGNLYEYLIEKADWKSTRKEFKQKLFASALFGKNVYEGKIIDVFNEEFPTVNKILRMIKNDNHAALPILLQSIESDVMIQRVSEKLFKLGIFHFTVHDSIMVSKQDDKKIVIDIIQKEFAKEGIFVKLKINDKEIIEPVGNLIDMLIVEFDTTKYKLSYYQELCSNAVKVARNVKDIETLEFIRRKIDNIIDAALTLVLYKSERSIKINLYYYLSNINSIIDQRQIKLKQILNHT